MKIALGFEIINGSWGGGNQFATSLVKASTKKGFEITYDLKENDIDIMAPNNPSTLGIIGL